MGNNKTGLINRLKRSPDNQFYVDLREYLNFRISVIKNQLLTVNDDQEAHRLQGRGMELQELLTDLGRKPVAKQATGAFN